MSVRGAIISFIRFSTNPIASMYAWPRGWQWLMGAIDTEPKRRMK